MDELFKKLDLSQKSPGTWLGTRSFTSLHTLTSYTPITGKELLSIQTTTMEQMQELIAGAHEAFLEWRQVPAPVRGGFVREIGEKLREYKDALGTLVALETGKSKVEGDGEVQEMIDMADFAVGQSRMLYGKSMHSERAQHRLYEQWHPLGAIGVISAFNFPVAVWSWNTFLALICGNSVVWKPSPKTPLCSLAVHQLCAQILEKNRLPAVLSLITSEAIEVSKAFVDDPRLPLISFTGSTKVGREVGVQVARRFGRSLLELSGNNGALVDETADLKQALPAIVFGAVGTCGQRCTSLRRLFVHDTLMDKVKSELISTYKQLKIGDPLDPSTHMGPLIDQKAVECYQKALENISLQGGSLLYGGKVLQREGYFVEPTLVQAHPSMPLLQEETFAPILYLIPFHTIEEAIEMNNHSEHGLSSALFTQSLRNAEKFLSFYGSDCGIANINCGTSGAEIGGAFGGEKATGGGREAGSDSWKAYMRRQTVAVNWGQELPLAQGISFRL